MARRFAPHRRLTQLQRSIAPLGPRVVQTNSSSPPPPREPQVVDRRGAISAFVQATPTGYEIFWQLVRGDGVRDLDRRGPYPTRALAVCWARVVLMLREEAWRSVHLRNAER